jgi:hypothetical protein
MGTVELFRHEEKAAWTQFLSTRSSADLTAWRAALERLHGELQSRVRLLSQRRVQTSARAAE